MVKLFIVGIIISYILFGVFIGWLTYKVFKI